MLPCFDAGQSPPPSTTVDQWVQALPGAVLFFAFDSLITKFWHELKRITPQIKWTRIENTGAFGTPDLLGYNANGHFFTVELKVTRGNSVRFSPHQISFHKLHPKNSFILAKHLASSRLKHYEGKKIMELVACGLKLEACCLGLGLEACGLRLSSLGA